MRFSARVKKYLIIFLVLISSFAVSTKVFAESQPELFNSSLNADVPRNITTLTQSVTLGVLTSAACLLTGIDPSNPEQKCLGFDPQTKKIGYVDNNGGAIGVMGNMIAMLYTPPVSSVDSINTMANNFGIGEKAYAQGIGYVGLQPIAKLWAGFRNLAYLAFMIVFIVIGLAVMLRVKIDPRTVMTIENQIPKIIVSLVLVTFSFAIAGLLIDLMYVSIYLIFNMFISNSNFTTGAVSHKILDTQKTFNSNNVFGIMNNLVGFIEIVKDASGGVKDIVMNLFSTSGTDPKTGVGIWDFFDKNIVNVLQNVLGGIVGWLAGILAFLVIAGAIIFAMFRLWFSLIKAYVYIIFDIIIAPLWILSGLLPGGAAPGFSGWLRNMVAHLSAFPVTIALFVIARVIKDGMEATAPGAFFVPPLIGNPGGVGAIGNMITMGIILIAPQAVQITQDFFKAPQFKYSSAIGQGIGAGAAVPSRAGTAVARSAVGSEFKEGWLGPGGLTTALRALGVGRH